VLKVSSRSNGPVPRFNDYWFYSPDRSGSFTYFAQSDYESTQDLDPSNVFVQRACQFLLDLEKMSDVEIAQLFLFDGVQAPIGGDAFTNSFAAFGINRLFDYMVAHPLGRSFGSFFAFAFNEHTSSLLK
jgi:hypothetical protein